MFSISLLQINIYYLRIIDTYLILHVYKCIQLHTYKHVFLCNLLLQRAEGRAGSEWQLRHAEPLSRMVQWIKNPVESEESDIFMYQYGGYRGL